MLKKSLISIAVLTTTLPSWAGSLKIHDPWPTTLVRQEVTTIDIQLDIGYFIHIYNQNPITVVQDTISTDPYHTYTGCKITAIETNFPAQLLIEVTGASAAGGMWSGIITPDVVPAGVTSVYICVIGTNVAIEKLVGDSKGIKAAEATILVSPQ